MHQVHKTFLKPQPKNEMDLQKLYGINLKSPNSKRKCSLNGFSNSKKTKVVMSRIVLASSFTGNVITIENLHLLLCYLLLLLEDIKTCLAVKMKVVMKLPTFMNISTAKTTVNT